MATARSVSVSSVHAECQQKLKSCLAAGHLLMGGQVLGTVRSISRRVHCAPLEILQRGPERVNI